MPRVTLDELSRLPPDRLARLLLEWASRDRTLLSRLHGTISAETSADTSETEADPASRDAKEAPVRLVGNSKPMRILAEMIDRFARTDEPVLITGESGTGKELAARAIHQQSSRAAGAFVPVNCAAIPANLIASELFGHEKGAFTGAVARSRGQVEHASGGTLFLDEIGDMPMESQSYMLRFLQEGQILRVGGRSAIDVNVRIVAATNVRLRQAISEGRFREDLFYRLNVLALEIPPLRERPDDIEMLARHFLRDAAIQYRREISDFEADALDVLRRYHWPGNVRELMSTIRRAVVIGRGELLERVDLIGLDDGDAPQASITVRSAPNERQGQASRPVPGSHDERDTLISLLADTGENIAVVARALGVSRVTVYRMLRRHDIVPSRGFNAAPGANSADLDDEQDQLHPVTSIAR